MRPTRRRQNLAAWLTLVTMTLAMLAPGISRAMSFAKGDTTPWGVVCSTSGRTADSGSPEQTAVHALDACGYCTLAGDAPPLPATPAQLSEPPALGRLVPALFLNAPRPLFAWHAAQPRAPPVLS
jgi:hypothetical protein